MCHNKYRKARNKFSHFVSQTSLELKDSSAENLSNPESLIQENKSEKFDQNKSFPLDLQKVSFIILILFLKQIKELLLLINMPLMKELFMKK